MRAAGGWGQIAVGRGSADAECLREFVDGFTGLGEPSQLLLSLGGQFRWLGGR